jgi:DNA-binding MarR family transcriptional regulator
MPEALRTNKELLAMAQQIDRDLGAIRRTLRQPAEAAFSKSGLTGPQRSVMQAVVLAGGLSLKEASRQMGLAHSTVSGIVDRLERHGVVGRQTDKKDHRVKLIVASKAPTLVVHPLVEALKRAKPAERKAVLEGLRILRRVLEP